MLVIGLLQLVGKIALTVTDCHRFVPVDTKHVRNIVSAQIKIQINKWHHKRAADGIEYQQSNDYISYYAHWLKDKFEKRIFRQNLYIFNQFLTLRPKCGHNYWVTLDISINR